MLLKLSVYLSCAVRSGWNGGGGKVCEVSGREGEDWEEVSYFILSANKEK